MKSGKIFKAILILIMMTACAYCAAQETANQDAVNTPSASPEPAKIDSKKYDFSDSSHWNLTISAWEHLADKDFDGVFAYAGKCIELYEEKAKEAARNMTNFLRFGHEDECSLVNDVATAHYIMGEAYMKQGKSDEAIKEFNYTIENYPYAQCWDPKGWFWKVAEISRKNIEKMNKAKGTVS